MQVRFFDVVLFRTVILVFLYIQMLGGGGGGVGVVLEDSPV